MSRYKRVVEGEWVRFKGRFLKMRCCDCGLVHTVEFVRAPQGLRAWRHESRRKRAVKR